MAQETTRDVALPEDFCRRLERLALRYERSVSDLVQYAVDVHFGEDAATARLRLMDWLARLEAGLGDPETLQEEIARDARFMRSPR